MADTPLSEAAIPVAPPRGSSRILLLAIAGAGLAVGLGGGFVAFAPARAHRRGAADGTADSTADSTAAHAAAAAARADEEKQSSPPPLVSLDNIVVNPAGTNGTRFLLVSAAFEVTDASAADQFSKHELEMRDRVVALLSAKNIAQLTDPAARDSLKLELIAQLGPLLAPGAIRRVHFPQFVIQ